MKKLTLLTLLLTVITVFAQNQTKLAEAEKLVTESVSGSVSDQVKAELGFADALRQSGYYSKALSVNIKAHKKAQSLKKKGLDLQEQAQYQLAVLFLNTGNLTIADRVIAQDLEMSEKLFSKKDWRHVRSMNLAGYIAIQLSDFSKAEGFLTKASEFASQDQTCPIEIKVQNNLFRAEYYRVKGSYAASEALMRMALKAGKSLPVDHEINQDASILYARLYKDLHNYGKAWRFLHKVETSYLSVNPSHEGMMKLNLELVDLFLLANATDSASLLMEQKLIPALSQVGKTVVYYDIQRLNGRLLVSKGKLEEADLLYADLSDSIGSYLGDRSLYAANALHEKAEYYYKAGKYEEALGTWQLVVDIQKDLLDNAHASYIKALNGQALVYWAQGRNGLAAGAFKKSADNYLTQFSKNFVFLNEKEKGLLYRDVRSFFEKYNRFILEDAIQNNGKSSLLPALYDNQLASKGFLFNSSIELKKYLNSTSDSTILLKTEKWLRGKEQLSKLYKLDEQELLARNISLDSIESYVSGLEKEMSLRTAINASKEEKEIPAWESVKAVLGEKEVAMEIIRVRDFLPDSGGVYSDKIYYVSLLISKDTKAPIIRYLSNGKELETRYIKYYKNTIHFSVADTISYNNFWKPFCTPQLVGSSTIYLSLDGVYNKISLATLNDPADGKYILDKFNLHILTNTKEVINVKSNKKMNIQESKSTAVFFGFPDYNFKSTSSVTASSAKTTNGVTRALQTRGDVRSAFRGGEISELPGTKVEVEGITKLFSQNQNILIQKSLGKTAVETSLKNIKHPTILHIATHGFFISPSNQKEGSLADDDADNPLLLSGVLLSGASHAYSEDVILSEIDGLLNGKQVDDGILSAYEAMNMDLKGTQLVVLSACETGLGEVKNGEGVFGLQRSLMTAGAESVIMSMWKVYDESTQKLMRYFYEEWIKTGDKRSSFVAAQQRLRKEYPEPVHWGAFVMIGD